MIIILFQVEKLQRSKTKDNKRMREREESEVEQRVAEEENNSEEDNKLSISMVSTVQGMCI